MSDYNLWKNGIEHSKSPTSLTDAVDGDGFVATAVISGVTTSSNWKMSLWDAYLDLYEKLHGGERPTPKSTTVEANALSGILDGTWILDIDTSRPEVCIGGVFKTTSGTTNTSTSNYAALYENNLNGSAMQSTSKLWNTALVGAVASAVGLTLVSDSTSSRATVTTAGNKHVSMFASFTNEGRKMTTATIMKNGVATALTVAVQGDSGDHRELVINGVLSSLAVNDVLTLKIVSATQSDVVKVYQCHMNFNLG